MGSGRALRRGKRLWLIMGRGFGRLGGRIGGVRWLVLYVNLLRGRWVVDVDVVEEEEGRREGFLDDFDVGNMFQVIYI